MILAAVPDIHTSSGPRNVFDTAPAGLNPSGIMTVSQGTSRIPSSNMHFFALHGQLPTANKDSNTRVVWRDMPPSAQTSTSANLTQNEHFIY